MPAAVAQEDHRTGRLRLTAVNLERRPSGHAACVVTLQWQDGQPIVGRADGLSSTQADLRLAAEATLRALRSFYGDDPALGLLGIKTLHAFDASIVIACVGANRDGKALRLLGCHLSDGDLLRSAVLAVLHAINRVLAP
ncbi:MAG TPA: hypothetical protein VNL96_01475 [Gemmatimonadaceae bacterium]|nr:hypothetical protein [Gemmatimonadaceae bacterium]